MRDKPYLSFEDSVFMTRLVSLAGSEGVLCHLLPSNTSNRPLPLTHEGGEEVWLRVVDLAIT